MLSSQQTGFRSYLSSAHIRVPKSLRRLFYMSWEDALWDLLAFLRIQPESIALVPEFFCVDVVENMQRHGLRCVEYVVDDQLQTDPMVFSKTLAKLQPKVVVILHAAGMTNNLFKHVDKWLPSLPMDALLIEDSVHRVVDPKTISLLSTRHVVMDSLRKVSPLMGSNLYVDVQFFSTLRETAWWRTIWYQLHLMWWWMITQSALLCSLPNVSEQAVLRGNEIIGDSAVSAPGWPMMRWLASHLAVESIRQTKMSQVKRYLSQLDWSTLAVHMLNMPESEFEKLRGLPVLLPLQSTAGMLEKIRKAGLLLRVELDDCTWSKKHRMIYLPLGPHLTMKDIDHVCDILRLHASV